MQLTDARPSRDPALFWVNHRDAPARTTAHAGARKRALALVLQPAGGGDAGGVVSPLKVGGGPLWPAVVLQVRAVVAALFLELRHSTAHGAQDVPGETSPNGRGLRAERGAGGVGGVPGPPS